MSLGAALKAALVAGLIAGGVVTSFYLLFAEPLIDRAIDLEQTHRPSHGGGVSEPLVSRRAQRVGLLVGQLMYGVVWGLLLGLSLPAAHRRFSPSSPGRAATMLALALGWSVAVFPFIKYPANPPGVGDPDTIGYRQTLYVSFVALSALGTTIALLLQGRLGRSWWSPAAAGYIVYAGFLFVAVPGNPDPVTMPGELVWRFRAVSLVGLVIFWAVLAAVFGWLVKKQSRALVSV